jgi:hypothetical protein
MICNEDTNSKGRMTRHYGIHKCIHRWDYMLKIETAKNGGTAVSINNNIKHFMMAILVKTCTLSG